MKDIKTSSFWFLVGTLCPPFLCVRLLAVFIASIGLMACSTYSATGISKSSMSHAEGRIQIYRDKYGTPHVFSNDNYGVYFGYGYALATDRLYQMEMLKRTAEGRVAEVLGEKYEELDIHIRTSYDHRSIRGQINRLTQADRDVLEGYAAGFNQRIEEVLESKDKLLPKEFVDGDFLPEYWSDYDTAMVFVGSIIHRYSDFNSELDNLGLVTSLTQRHGKDKAMQIFDASKWLTDENSPTTVPRLSSSLAPKLAVIKNEKGPILDDVRTRRVVTNADGQFLGTTTQPEIAAEFDNQIELHGYTNSEFQAASNFWSVSNKKLTDAEGALVNGPQFGFGLPSYVYGIGLHGGDFNVVGNTLLGLPALLFAHNGSVAWGSTAGMSDQVDVFQEALVEGDTDQYWHLGQPRRFERWLETIQVRGKPTIEAVARKSVHGMVMKVNTDKSLAYARARAWEGSEVATLVAWINLAKAKSLDDVQTSLQHVAANINFYYMDVLGNQAYTHGGRYPQRAKSHDSRLPTVGTGEQDWLGYKPYNDNPTVRNPEQGFIVNWNNRPESGWESTDLWTYTWSEADRSRHIIAELEEKSQFSASEIWAVNERVSYDDVSGIFLLPYLYSALDKQALSDLEQQSLVRLKAWNGEWRLHANGHYGAAELLLDTWQRDLFERVIGDDVGEQQFAKYAATNNPSNPLGPSMGSSVGAKVLLKNLRALDEGSLVYDFFNGEDSTLVLTASFKAAVNSLSTRYGDDVETWSLEPSAMTWKPFNFRGVPQANESTQLTLPAYMNRGSENNYFIAKNGRFIAYDVIPPGQSGFVSADGIASPNGADQMTLFKDFSYKEVPFMPEEVRAASVSQKTIKPIRGHADNAAKISVSHSKRYSAYNAMISIDENAPTVTKGGILHGQVVVVKDNIHVASMPNSAGTPALKSFVPTSNNPVVQKLLDQGAIILGKTNMHELAFGITSNNAEFGPVRNAHDPSRIAGGSSGGTAVAVALGIADMGLGTDTGGSTRIPSALNGVVGFRPTLGRYPQGGVTPVSSTRDTVGPIAKNISKTALLDCVITECAELLEPATLKGLKLGVPRAYFYENLAHDVSYVMDELLVKLTQAGVELVDVDLPELAETNSKVSFPVVLYEVMQELPEYLADNNTGVSMQQLVNEIASPDVKATFLGQMGKDAMPELAYRQAVDIFRPRLQSIYRDMFAATGVEALLVPTTALTATLIETSDDAVVLNGERVPTFPTFIRNTDPSSNAGLPSLTLPAGVGDQELPVGMMLDGPVDSDRRLFEIGLAIEQLLADGQ